MALDTFWVQDDDNAALADKARLQRLIEVTEKALTGDLDLEAEIAARRRSWQRRQHVLPVEPRVLIDNKASSKHTVIEINAPDRLGLLYDLTQALTDLGLSIVTARIATYGERAVDAFYVRDTYGLKTTHDTKTAEIKTRLLAVIGAATHPTPKIAGAAR
jgi:[protein-PII] uridylyltransferase